VGAGPVPGDEVTGPSIERLIAVREPKVARGLLERNGLGLKETVGLAPSAAPPKLIGLLRAIHRGEITPGEMGRRTPIRVSKGCSILYAGYATKATA
jgi:hypothetical protein